MPDALPVILADIGGTNTRVALADGTRLRAGSLRRFRNADHRTGGLDEVLRTYLRDAGGQRVDGACIAVAGPVRGGVGQLTNLDWTMDLAGLAAATGAGRVAILNDLQAQGAALAHLDAENLRPVLPGRGAETGAARLVIGVGTGFNAAPVHAPGGRAEAFPSECGHVTLPVRTAEELALADWLAQRHGFADVEEVLSGRGVTALDHFAGLAGDPAATPRPADAVMAALAAGEDRATAAGRLFVRFLGRVAGDLALVHLPFGGIYLVGGVARAFAPFLAPFGFAAAFRDKGRFGDFLDAFPLQLVEDDYAALLGCAAHLQAHA